MPTLLSDHEAARAKRKAEQRAALARAKQWHEDRHNNSPKKSVNKSTTKRESSAPALLAEAMPNRKSPSRAEARDKARAWADEKKRATVPAAIDTKQRGNAHRIAVVEEDSSTSDFSDDFQTALTRSSTKDNAQILVPKAHVKKVLEMKNQMKKALKRFEDLCEPYEESINSKLESMDIE